MRTRLVKRDLYVDFGVRKPHAVLIGRSRKARFVERLEDLAPTGCRIYVEAGCPREALRRVMDKNRILVVDGKIIKSVRDRATMPKSDLQDALVLRKVALTNPDVFREMTEADKRELERSIAYAYYWKLNKLIVSIKNRQYAFQAEFGEVPPQLADITHSLEKHKAAAGQFLGEFTAGARNIGVRGVGPKLLGGICIKAHPDRFHSLSAYLGYCGFKASSKTSGRYNRHVKSLYYQLACSVIIHKDKRFYKLYRKVKHDLEIRFPDHPNWRIEGMARNRVSTFLAKIIYHYLRDNRAAWGEELAIGLLPN